MNVEVLIYAYLAICISMIVFNCACVFVFRGRDRSMERRSTRLESAISEQLQRIRDKKPVEEAHQAFLQRKLARTNGLMAFDETVDRLLAQDPENTWTYIREIRQVFTYLSMENTYRSAMKKTYFAHIIRKYRIIEGRPTLTIVGLLLELVREPSLYCRESALQAIYTTGDCGYVLQALHMVDQSGRFHHAKLLTDGLLNFSGDRQELFRALWDAFETFSVPMRAVILDCIRFGGGSELQEELLQLLADSRQDDELRFSCIRYFGRYAYEPAFPLLLDFVDQRDQRRWEYAAIAATSLGSYPGQRTVEVLKRALSSANWYVRYNAAKSLDRFHLTYLELSDVLESNDRYAREILQYQMDMSKATREREVAAV